MVRLAPAVGATLIMFLGAWALYTDNWKLAAYLAFVDVLMLIIAIALIPPRSDGNP
jgi:hypothetical protein